MQSSKMTGYIILYGAIISGNAIFITAGNQIGEIGRLGIISIIDVPFTYILQALLLNETNDYLVYIGAAIVLIGIIILLLEQYRLRQTETNGDEEDQAEPALMDDSDMHCNEDSNELSPLLGTV